MEYIIIAVVIAVVLLGAATGLVVNGKRRKQLPELARWRLDGRAGSMFS